MELSLYLNQTKYFMRKLLFIGLAALAFSSCEKANELTQFDVDFTSAAIIPATINIGIPFEIGTPAIDSEAKSEVENNNTNIDLVESFKLTELKIDIITPDDGNFNFLESIKVLVSAEGLDDTEIAANTSVSQDSVRSISLEVTDTELLDFLKEEKFELKVQVTTDETIGEDHSIEVYTKFRVDAKLL